MNCPFGETFHLSRAASHLVKNVDGSTTWKNQERPRRCALGTPAPWWSRVARRGSYRETQALIQRLAASGLAAISDPGLGPLPAPITGFWGPMLARQIARFWNAKSRLCGQGQRSPSFPFTPPCKARVAGWDPGHSFYLATTKPLALGPTGKGSPGGRERKAGWILQVVEGLLVPAWSAGQAQ